jgi:hypothetical protein
VLHTWGEDVRGFVVGMNKLLRKWWGVVNGFLFGIG